MDKIRIAILCGGWSSEREISLKGGKAIFQALSFNQNYELFIYDPKYEIHQFIDRAPHLDLVFNLLHGKFGEDGQIQGMLNILGLPYVGSDVLSSSMAMNKIISKDRYRLFELPVAKDVVINKFQTYSLQNITEYLGLKTVVKPCSQGSSLGMSICNNSHELEEGIIYGFQFDEELIIEEYIKGREFTCCVIGKDQLTTYPVIEIIPNGSYKFFDYQAKYIKGESKEICPAEIDDATSLYISELAIKAHNALRCSIWSRSDFLMKDKDVYILETNTIPGMTNNSLFPLAASKAGLSFHDLLENLIKLSMS